MSRNLLHTASVELMFAILETAGALSLSPKRNIVKVLFGGNFTEMEISDLKEQIKVMKSLKTCFINYLMDKSF